jgi:hypothetical protein
VWHRLIVLSAVALSLARPTTAAVSQQAYLKASNTEAGDRFGGSPASISGEAVIGSPHGVAVAISGDTMVVGAPQEDSNATGVNGNQSDNSATNSGAAYVFVRNGTTWIQQAYLKASNTEPLLPTEAAYYGDSFGTAVAISGDTIVVGAYLEDSAATGVNGNQSDNSAVHAGAAYVFVRNGTTWSQQAYLKPSTTAISQRFGYSVAISGDTIAVGAVRDPSNFSALGATYVFVRNGTNWSEQARLKVFNSGSFDLFGSSVGISGHTLVVGAPEEDSNATGVNGNHNDDSAVDSGAAYVFVRDGTNWSQQAYLKASNTGGTSGRFDYGDNFGWAVAASGDTAVVGAPGEDSNATGINGNQSDNSATNSGAVYVFVRNGTNWSQEAYLKQSSNQMFREFGTSVAVERDTLVAGGASGRETFAVVLGEANVFQRTGTKWAEQAVLQGSNTEPFDYFGFSVALSGDTAVVGAWGEDSAATGVNGNQNDNSATNSGAAYVFTGLPMRPSLAIQRLADSVRIAWPLPATDFQLEETPTLSDSPSPWAPVSVPYETNSTQISITVPASDDARFYRLSRP